MKHYTDLTRDQREKAIARSLRYILQAITDGDLQFDDLANKNNSQERIDRTCVAAERE